MACRSLINIFPPRNGYQYGRTMDLTLASQKTGISSGECELECPAEISVPDDRTFYEDFIDPLEPQMMRSIWLRSPLRIGGRHSSGRSGHYLEEAGAHSPPSQSAGTRPEDLSERRLRRAEEENATHAAGRVLNAFRRTGYP